MANVEIFIVKTYSVLVYDYVFPNIKIMSTYKLSSYMYNRLFLSYSRLINVLQLTPLACRIRATFPR